MRRLARSILVIVFLNAGITAVLADASSLPNAPTEDSVKTLALRWYTQMQMGQLDRTQLTAAYSAQVSDDAVRAMAREVNLYGAPPTSAKVLQSRMIGDQKFYLVKLIFPRGDAAGLPIGFGPQGKITGINFVSMAGD